MIFNSQGFTTVSVVCLLPWTLLCSNSRGVAKPIIPEDTFTSGMERDVAQATPRQEERERPRRINYVGIGGTLGFSNDGETKLGDGGFSIMSRTSFTDVLSLHTASVIGGDSYSSFAITGSPPIGGNRNRATAQRRRPPFVPFAGAGIGVEFEDFDIDPMVTVGADIPISNSVTGTARVNANFGEEGTDFGLVLGVGIRLFR